MENRNIEDRRSSADRRGLVERRQAQTAIDFQDRRTNSRRSGSRRIEADRRQMD